MEASKEIKVLGKLKEYPLEIVGWYANKRYNDEVVCIATLPDAAKGWGLVGWCPHTNKSHLLTLSPHELWRVRATMLEILLRLKVRSLYRCGSCGHTMSGEQAQKHGTKGYCCELSNGVYGGPGDFVEVMEEDEVVEANEATENYRRGVR